jgi:large subunit ribosomal protein L10
MNREQKAAVVDQLSEEISAADAIFAVDYRGISVADAAELRSRLRDAETRFRVVKNSLTERATDQAGAELLKPLLVGPTALAFVGGDAAVAAKALNDAARTLGTLEFKGGVMNGAALSAEDVRFIARLPSREVLNGQLVGTIASPLSQLVGTLNALIAGVAIQLQQMAEQGLVSGEAPAEAPSASDAQRASDADGEAAASDASAPDADDAPPEPEAAAPAEPEASAEPEAAAPAAETQSSEETETEGAADAESSEA